MSLALSAGVRTRSPSADSDEADEEIRSLRGARDELANESDPIVDRGLGNANEGVVGPFVDVPQLFAERHRVVERHDPLLVGRVDVTPRLEEQHVTLIPKRFDGRNAQRGVRPGSDGVDDTIWDPAVEDDRFN